MILEQFTQSLKMDMPYDVFWHGDPMLYYNYLEAYEQRQKAKNEIFINQENFKAWLQGMYIDYALACNHPLAKQKKPYLDKPIELKKPDIEKEEKEEIKESGLTEKQEQAAIAQFMAFGKLADAFNAQNKGK